MPDYETRLVCAVSRVVFRLDEGQDPHEAAEEFSRAYTVSPFDILALIEYDQRKAEGKTRVALRRVGA